MILQTKIIKLIAGAGIALGSIQGMGSMGKNIESVVNLPKRFLTLSELRILKRQVAYETKETSLSPENWIKDKLKAPEPRKPGEDLWGTPFRFINTDGRKLNRVPRIEHAFGIASAGPDKDFSTEDDVIVTNRTDSLKETELEVNELLGTAKTVKKMAKKEKADSKASRSFNTLPDAIPEGLKKPLEEAIEALKNIHAGPPSSAKKRYKPFDRLKKLQKLVS